MIAIDWGTSTLRGALLAAGGGVLEERSFPRGILTVAPGGFAEVFQHSFGDWLQAPGQVTLMAGMVGSQQGWQEAAYCPCPAGFAEVAQALTWLTPGRLAIVPGLSCRQTGLPADPALGPLQDVMRGEETQILGALHALGLRDALMVLPGTHCKWARVSDARITGFSTHMTGEFFHLLRQHSILSRTLPEAESPPDDAAFALGVSLALQGRGLLHNAFSVRTLALFQQMPAERLHDYLSGLVIGEEVRAQQAQALDTPVILIGADALTRRYQQALALAGVQASCLSAAVTWTGLWQLATHLGLSP